LGDTPPQLPAPAQSCADADYRQGARDRIGVSGIKGKDGPKAISTTTRETLANRTNPRENGPVIAGLDWSDGRQAARFL
jgi:hypothetical protein